MKAKKRQPKKHHRKTHKKAPPAARHLIPDTPANRALVQRLKRR